MAKIIGNPTVTPMAVPDWNQNNPTKADYIKNKPDLDEKQDKTIFTTKTKKVENPSTIADKIPVNSEVKVTITGLPKLEDENNRYEIEYGCTNMGMQPFGNTSITPDEKGNATVSLPITPYLVDGADYAEKVWFHIFDLGGIASLFVTSEMISVTKKDGASWDELKPLIMAEIMDYLSMGEDVSARETESDNNVEGQIISLLNARIRPAVKKDGGVIKFVSFDNGVVKVEMQGACKGCPYAMRTLKDGVERILKTYIPEVKEVRNIEDNNA